MGRRLSFADVSLALLATVGLPAAGRPARADWHVHRDGTRALIERAEQALRESPDDAAVARRLVHLAGKSGAPDLRARFRARAAGATSYAPVAAYAQVLAAMGQPDTAAAAFAEALRLAPGSAAALLGHAQALAAAGNAPAAIDAYDDALAPEHRPAARRRLIEAQLELGPVAPRGAALERAIGRRRELCALAPESAREAERLADLLEQAGRPGEAAAALEARVPRAHPTAKLALALRAARLRAADHDAADADRAAGALAALLADLPRGAADSRRSVWSCARDVARLRGTLGELEKQLQHAPGPIEWDLLGQVRDELGDLDGALAATRTAHGLAPRDAAIGRRLIALLGRLGRDAEAITVYQDLERRIPGDSTLSIELAERQRADGDRAAAESTFDRALVRFAHTPRALGALAELAARWSDDRRALAAWTRLSRLDPNDELALVGLGEAQFQLGHRDQARRTWSALRGHAGSAADGHLRLGELLYDHELLDDANEEAKHAAAAAPSSAEPHRLLARIAERQRRPAVAQEEWRRVLDLGRAPAASANGGGLRREARTHLLTLIAAQGRGQLDAEVHRLREEAAQHPEDAEATLFLAEAEQRLGDVNGAIETLRALLARAATAGPGGRETAVEAGFALSRLLKRTGQLDEAAARLAELARLAPGRAREAELQLADLALDRGDVVGALGHADAAEPGADATALVRVAEIRERAGDDARAVATYQKAASDGGPPSAALAVARILAREADAAGAAAAIETLLATAHDDASLSDAARRVLVLDEYLNRLPALAEALQPSNPDGEETPARRRALVDVLRRLLPQLARDPAGDEARARIGRLALRPLLDLVADTDAPDRDAIELVGLLGNPDATPALARLVKPAGATNAPPRAPRGSFELRQVALIALGRLASPRALDVLEPATAGGSREERA
ncbi:MAG TPA: tetratricopeptide repeat protein, partial [Polyangia bacterium]|nr:tetratricopeptide repeat protein [Polyangia bacterium]